MGTAWDANADAAAAGICGGPNIGPPNRPPLHIPRHGSARSRRGRQVAVACARRRLPGSARPVRGAARVRPRGTIGARRPHVELPPRRLRDGDGAAAEPRRAGLARLLGARARRRLGDGRVGRLFRAEDQAARRAGAGGRAAELPLKRRGSRRRGCRRVRRADDPVERVGAVAGKGRRRRARAQGVPALRPRRGRLHRSARGAGHHGRLRRLCHHRRHGRHLPARAGPRGALGQGLGRPQHGADEVPGRAHLGADRARAPQVPRREADPQGHPARRRRRARRRDGDRRRLRVQPRRQAARPREGEHRGAARGRARGAGEGQGVGRRRVREGVGRGQGDRAGRRPRRRRPAVPLRPLRRRPPRHHPHARAPRGRGPPDPRADRRTDARAPGPVDGGPHGRAGRAAGGAERVPAAGGQGEALDVVGWGRTGRAIHRDSRCIRHETSPLASVNVCVTRGRMPTGASLRRDPRSGSPPSEIPRTDQAHPAPAPDTPADASPPSPSLPPARRARGAPHRPAMAHTRTASESSRDAPPPAPAAPGRRPKPRTGTEIRAALEDHYRVVSSVILAKMNPLTGLLPASTAVTIHGDYTDAWVRDNINSIFAVFALALAYRRIDDSQGRYYELQHCVVKNMRGMMGCMMKQAPKVEKFKHTQAPMDALHAKYSTTTGDVVVGDAEWGHLQIDATSLFLIALAQMTLAGLEIVWTMDEVDFVQNLTYYIERAYRTPDFGHWERGDKINHGRPELNSSSIGMALAALESINGVNLFGARGGPASVVRVLEDEVARNRVTIEAALPRESASKEVDAAVLAAISFPSFAVRDPELVELTKREIITKLQGNYGLKRFLRDGHQCALEDISRIYYDPHELQIFEKIESEWPLFYTYLLLDGIFNGDAAQVEEYRERIENILVDSTTVSGFDPHSFVDLNVHFPALHGTAGADMPLKSPLPPDSIALLPELYFVPKQLIEAERAEPRSQKRLPGENVPLVWAQSLWITAQLLMDGLIEPADMDPLGRRFNARRPKKDTVVQVVLVAESPALQARLRNLGMETQTMDELGTVAVRGPNGLRDALSVLGMNQKLGLTGRPQRAVGILSTSKLWRVEGSLYSFLPIFLDRDEFYGASDPDYMVDLFVTHLNFLKNHWNSPGRPTMTILITEQLMRPFRHVSRVQPGRRTFLQLVNEAKAGQVGDVRVRLGRMQEMVPTSCIESLDFLTRRVGTAEDWKRILSGKASFDASVPMDKLTLDRTIRTRKQSGGLSRRDSAMFKSFKLPIEEIATTDAVLGTTAFEFPSPTNPPSALPTSYISSKADKAGSYFAAEPEREDPPADGSWRLKKHVGGTVEIEPINESLALDVSDPSKVPDAVAALRESSSLFDQADILEYLKAVKGGDFDVQGAGKVDDLLEEIYQKASNLALWNVVRQTAALLRKTPSGLSQHLLDLLVRRIPLSVGHGPGEFLITTTGRPMGDMNAPSVLNPKEIASLMYDHVGDSRDGAMLIEVVMALSDASKADPHLLAGVARLRISKILGALVDELSRTYSEGYEAAHERLMALSPTEVRTLVRKLLEAHDTAVQRGPQRTATPISGGGLLKGDVEAEKAPARVARLPKVLELRAQSAGESAGNFATVDVLVDGQPVALPDSLALGPASRGLVVVVVDTTLGIVTFAASFDTHAADEEAADLAGFVEELKDGEAVAVACKDDSSEHLAEPALAAIEAKLGSKLVRKIGFRDSWALVAVAGDPSTTRESLVPASEARPSDRVELRVDMAAARERINFMQLAENEAFATSASLAMLAPSLGEWYRRRAVDGALNRVPEGFYKKVWDLLSHSKGLSLSPAPSDGSKTLHSQPLVSEKTAEEFNFAMAVETWLDAVEDAASREVVCELVDCMGVKERDGVVNLVEVVRDAISAHWTAWASSYVADGGSADIAEHTRLATRIFEDLSEEEARRYLTAALGDR